MKWTARVHYNEPLDRNLHKFAVIILTNSNRLLSSDPYIQNRFSLALSIRVCFTATAVSGLKSKTSSVWFTRSVLWIFAFLAFKPALAEDEFHELVSVSPLAPGSPMKSKRHHKPEYKHEPKKCTQNQQTKRRPTLVVSEVVPGPLAAHVCAGGYQGG